MAGKEPKAKRKRGRPPRTEGWTQQRLADEIGRRFSRRFSAAAVQKWAADGAPMDDPDALERWYRENRLVESGDSELKKAKLRAEVRRAEADAIKAEHLASQEQIKLEKLRSSVCSIEDHNRIIAKIGLTIRKVLQNVPRANAKRFMAAMSEHQAETILDEIVRDALVSLQSVDFDSPVDAE